MSKVFEKSVLLFQFNDMFDNGQRIRLFLYVLHWNREDWQDVILRNMSERKDWWPMVHFTRFHALKDSEENPELFEIKASVIKVLCPGR